MLCPLIVIAAQHSALSIPMQIINYRSRFSLISTVVLYFFVCLCFASHGQSLESQILPKGARIFLLGEIHDNPNSHSLRMELVRQLISERPKPVVAMEQFDRENQPALDLALDSCADVECVLDKTGPPGWEWRFYKPLVQLALEKKITLIAANLSNADMRRVMANGFSAVYSPQVIAEHKLDQIPAQLLSAQQQSIQEGHCNMLPTQAIGPMAKAQIARDVWMASVMSGVQNQTVILIAGNGHVRKDAGVFQWLSPENKAQTQVHGYVEAQDKRDPNWFDYVHVVPTIEREDQCLVFQKKQIKK